MFLFDKCRASRQARQAQKLEKERDRLLNEAYTRRAAQRCAQDYQDRKSVEEHHRHQDFLRGFESMLDENRRRDQAQPMHRSRSQHHHQRPRTAPSQPEPAPSAYHSAAMCEDALPYTVRRKPVPQSTKGVIRSSTVHHSDRTRLEASSKGLQRRPTMPTAFDTDSDEDDVPSWVGRSYAPEFPDRWDNARKIPSRRRAPKVADWERAMPDVASRWPPRVDSLPKRSGPANYHPDHGHRYLRVDEEFLPPVSYIAPLNPRRRGSEGTRRDRTRTTRKDSRTPQWVGPCPPGWF